MNVDDQGRSPPLFVGFNHLSGREVHATPSTGTNEPSTTHMHVFDGSRHFLVTEIGGELGEYRIVHFGVDTSMFVMTSISNTWGSLRCNKKSCKKGSGWCEARDVKAIFS